jgi:hypothetical protein
MPTARRLKGLRGPSEIGGWRDSDRDTDDRPMLASLLFVVNGYVLERFTFRSGAVQDDGATSAIL